MLEQMTKREFEEWLAFFNIRNRLRQGEQPGRPTQGFDNTPEGQRALARKIRANLGKYENNRKH